MADRKKTPNILGDLLGGGPSLPEPPASKPAQQAAALPAKQDASKPATPNAGKAVKPKDGTPAKTTAAKTVKSQGGLLVKQQAVAPVKLQAVLPVEAAENEDELLGTKIKVTFYLSEDAVESLDDAQSKLRKLVRAHGLKKSKAATSKSALLEEAVRLVCEELEEKGMESQIARVLL